MELLIIVTASYRERLKLKVGGTETEASPFPLSRSQVPLRQPYGKFIHGQGGKDQGSRPTRLGEIASGNVGTTRHWFSKE